MSLLGFVFIFTYIGVIGTVIGILPSAGIGMLTGALVGGIHQLCVPWLTRVQAWGVGFFVGMAGAATVHGSFWYYTILPFDSLFLYAFLLGVPTVIYLGLSVWFSDRLFREASTQRVSNGSV